MVDIQIICNFIEGGYIDDVPLGAGWVFTVNDKDVAVFNVD